MKDAPSSTGCTCSTMLLSRYHWVCLLGISLVLLSWVPPALPRGWKKGSLPLSCPSRRCRCRRNHGEVILKCLRTSGVLPHFELHKNITYQLVQIVEQNLTDIPNGAFKNIPTKTLDLSGNSFYHGLPEAAFEGLGRNLKTLVLSDSHLPEVPALQNLTILGSLKLDGNNISTVPSEAFQPAVNLKELHLYRNFISRIEQDAFAGLLRLVDLKLFDNQLKELPRKVFSGLGMLESLDISRNKLNTLLPATFKGLSSLRWLVLEHNQLTVLSKGVFKGLPRLKYLKLEGNPLQTIEDGTLGAIKRLSYLSIDIANVTHLRPNTFDGLNKLKNLNLGEINRSSLPDRLFRSMDSIQYLSLYDFEARLDNLSSSVFSHTLRFNKLKVWIDPLYGCQCDLPWINDLTRKGAYLIGYCTDRQPISCVNRQNINIQKEITGKNRRKRKKGRGKNT